MLKGYAIIVGIILILAGIDNWAHILPLVQLDSPSAAVLSVVVGIVGVILGLKGKAAEEKPSTPASPPPTTSPTE